jgi:hypothetical protein
VGEEPAKFVTYQGKLLILRIFGFHLHLGSGVSVQYKIFVDYFGKKVYKNLENKLGPWKNS